MLKIAAPDEDCDPESTPSPLRRPFSWFVEDISGSLEFDAADEPNNEDTAMLLREPEINRLFLLILWK